MKLIYKNKFLMGKNNLFILNNKINMIKMSFDLDTYVYIIFLKNKFITKKAV